jgi:hypothetical protein
MSGFTLLFLAIAAVALIDAIAHPMSDWLEADRNRGFWLTMIVILNIAGAVLYALFVRPRFSHGSGSIDPAFRKNDTSNEAKGRSTC